jgi:hypothetical protein
MLVDVTTALIRTIFLICAILRERFIFVAGYIYAVSENEAIHGASSEHTAIYSQGRYCASAKGKETC